MRSQAPRVAIVGAGLMGHWHAAAARRAGAHVVAVVDTDRARAERLARRFGAVAANDVGELLSLSQRPAVAHLCTPAANHALLAFRLFEHGLHVVCEKPLAPDAGTVQAMFAAASAARRRLIAVHQYTAQRGVSAALAAVPHTGRLLSAAFVFRSAGAEHQGLDADRDALVAEVLPHPLSVLARLAPGRPLGAVPWSVVSTEPGECVVTGCLTGTLVSIAVSFRARPTRAAAELACEAATIDLDFFHGFAAVRRGRPSRSDKAMRPFADAFARLGAATLNACRRVLTWESAYPGLRALLTQAYASLGEDAQPDGIQVPEVMLDLYRARDRIVAALAQQRAQPPCKSRA